MAEVVAGISRREFPDCGMQVIIDRAVFSVAPLPSRAVKFGVNSVPDYSFLPEGNLIGRLAQPTFAC
jgi:hypothetical protein